MQPETDRFDAFARAYDAGRASLVSLTLVADLETPVAAFLKLKGHYPGPGFLLESVEGGAVRGRYSMIGLDPDLIWRCKDRAEIARDAALAEFVADDRHPLESLRALIAESAIGEDASETLPPMAAGLFGYLGYDMVRRMERLPQPNPDPLGVPDAILIRPRVMVIFDAVADQLTVVTPVRPVEGMSAKAAYEAALDRIDRATAALEAPLPIETRVDAAGLSQPTPVSNTPPDDYLRMVAKAKEYIVAGDIFQVVLSQRFEAPFTLPAFALYRSLRRTNPAPFLCYLDFSDFQVVCSSPEILVRVRDDKVTIRPIAGTRRRGATPAEDKALADELLADPKERSEHLMLLDLGRNDVGRVSKIGTVTVTSSFFLEYYSQVMHIVSNVEGELDPRHDTLSALAAGFPAGTVSGAPKVRAMEIIDELEREKRGPYGGCIGYFGARGEMDTCIVLRTAIVKDGRMHVQAGAGIVYDSDPQSEQQECVNKAKALFRAAEDAVQFASRARRGQ
ncbi:anthranilate synthase component I [Methylobacterium gnaphalii]|uniref:Anthranilate synthase component 1 n=1 Tax=Methylobacterium gnaphalii TaxID=1010610 RepID=A0A512JJ48_9HYPH|nr:anthranilate synthase component I [Methylobacterium gnaphalii]GEP09979.1 anthranilate synthase component I [Methylobacterium gnaphalii]GJD68973.1 Anthranilate synthase component 1 [Methylobacterium gnaphalii]GLS48250.1 anthranilate synthase component I [Methylobacterium gnaphalii]